MIPPMNCFIDLGLSKNWDCMISMVFFDSHGILDLFIGKVFRMMTISVWLCIMRI